MSELGKAKDMIYLKDVSRITIVSDEGVEFERYGLYEHGIEVHLQDDGRTLKIFPKRKD